MFSLEGYNTSRRAKKVYQYKSNKLVNEYPSVREASRKTGISVDWIGLCARGKREEAGGFLWKYEK